MQSERWVLLAGVCVPFLRQGGLFGMIFCVCVVYHVWGFFPNFAPISFNS